MEKFDILTDIEIFAFTNETFITKEFLTYNIDRINQEQQKNLIEFYCKICYNYESPLINYSNETYQIYGIDNQIKYALENLYILLFGCPSKDTEKEYFLNIKYYTLNFTDFVKVIQKLKNRTDLDLNGFKDILINQKDKIFKDEFIIIPGYTYEDTKIYDTQFSKNYISTGIFNLRNNKDTHLLVQDNIEERSIFDIYQIIDVNYIRYNCMCINHQSFVFIILEIHVNGKKVSKFEDIIYPFKYLIPNTDINLIYEENGVYNIVYNLFFSLWDDGSIEWGDLKKARLLGNFDLKKDIYIYQINPNNQFFLNKFTSNSNFENWNSLCLNYQLNGYNIMYVNLNSATTDTNGYSCSYNKYSNIFNFDKKSIFKKKIEAYSLTNFKLLNTKLDTHLLEFNIDNTKDDKRESYKKLLFKISECKINQDNKPEWIIKFNKIKELLENKIKRFTDYIKNLTLGILLDNYSLLQSYLLNIKIYNFIKKILNNIDNQDNLCSIIKNYNYLFDTKQIPYKYKFEILFELITGTEILKEQMEKYIIIINSHYNYKQINQTGAGVPLNIHKSDFVHNYPSAESFKYNDDLIDNEGSLIDINIALEYNNELLKKCESNKYQLHHFMMGKGKSSIITPLLSLYLSIIKKQKIYIIVPNHLVKQTNSTLEDYLAIFQIDDILIKSEDEIKKEFLDESLIKTQDTVFLIDEFDSFINPLKSNFNYIQDDITDDKINIDDIRSVIKNIIDLHIIKHNELLEEIIKYKTIKNPSVLADNILSIIEQLINAKIKFNINWGIDSEKLFAIPFRNKDKPLKNSSFTSCIKTLFLTYYYYIKIKKYKIDDNIYNYLKYNYQIFNSYFMIPFENLTLELINSTLEKLGTRNSFFDLLFNEIFSKIKLSKEQYNTSSIDIINIDKIFKIGYSGTININLPIIQNTFRFDENCKYIDEDESNNVEYAIQNADLYNINKLLTDYRGFNALIDVCGYYHIIPNYEIAFQLYEKLKTNIIFIDEKDEKMVIIETGELKKLNENIVYNNPFFYYDQGHTIGIDIKQDNYPILHGLCIVDNLSYYSEVAQAIFRLRKLNLGHRISFVLNKITTEEYNQQQLLDLFRQNEINLINQQKNNLNLQALKSETRKNNLNLQALKSETRKNISDSNFKERYKETLFYYFKEDFPKHPLEIIFPTEIKEITKKLKFYELELSEINKIICDLDFESTEIQHQVNTQIQHQVNSKQNTQIQIQTQIKQNVSSNRYEIFEKYLFKNFEFIKNIKTIENYNNATFIIDEIISFLPNIFYGNHSDYTSNIRNRYMYSNNNLIFVFIHSVEKFILIPLFMVVYLYDTFLMFDLNFNIINFELIIHKNDSKIKELKENKFVKIITNNCTSEEIEGYIIDFSRNRENKSYIFSFLISYYLFTLLGIADKNEKYSKVIHVHNRILNPQNIITDAAELNKHNHLIRNVIRSDKSKRKYLKYKTKYLKLKNNLYD